jgi:hypothetical protein
MVPPGWLLSFVLLRSPALAGGSVHRWHHDSMRRSLARSGGAESRPPGRAASTLDMGPTRTTSALGMLAPANIRGASTWGPLVLLERAQTLLANMHTTEWEAAEQERWTSWAAQFTPFFRLVQSTVSREEGAGDERDEGMQLLFIEPAVSAETETVGAIAEKIARDAVRHGREEARVRRCGPDGVGVRAARNARTGTSLCLAAEQFCVASILSGAPGTSGDGYGPSWARRSMELMDGLQRAARLHGSKLRARPPYNRRGSRYPTWTRLQACIVRGHASIG